MNDLISERTLPVIAAEINTIKHQTGKILLASAIEIGRRLKEAKSLLPYGEWGKWLEESFSYSQKTAEKLMRVFETYGNQGPASLNISTQAQELPNLNYTQAFILLSVPETERAEFIAEMDVEAMSTRELQKAVNERSQAIKERDLALREKADLQKTLDDQAGQINQLNTERDRLKAKSAELSKSHGELEAKARQLNSELLSVKKSASFENIRKMTKTLNEAHRKACANKITFLYDSLTVNYKQLTWELEKFTPLDPETSEVYRHKVKDFLLKSIREEI